MSTTTQTIAIESIQLPGRVRLSYVEQGDPEGVPVVMLHGVTDSWHSYERLLPHLPPSIHAFALSQRGHGDSERPAAGYRARDFVADLVAFLDAQSIARAVIVGHSLGGTVAQRFAIDQPERTLGLVLIGAFVNYGNNPAVVELAEAIATLTDPIDERFAREFQESTLTKPVPPAFLDTVVAETMKVPTRVSREALVGLINDDVELIKELGQIRAPTLIAWGDQDAYVPRNDPEALQATITGSRLVIYPGVGHDNHWEEPEHFAADLVAFVDSLAGSA